jgi:hypothetical protein
MKSELQNKLYTKYPKIFRQKDLPITQTCMCWGIDTGDGWYLIIDFLCKKIQDYVDNKNIPQIEAVQVKEKFGGLRFYTNYSDNYVDKEISFAETASYKTCECCGSTEEVSQTEGWIVTLCKKCMENRSK